MPDRRSLTWPSALRDLRADRATWPEIREERLRPLAALVMGAWRGRSGRRYVVAVHGLTLDALDDAGPAVCLAVTRAEQGVASVVAVSSDMTRAVSVGWLCRAHHAGATELHVHRLAECTDKRAAIVGDLQ